MNLLNLERALDLYEDVKNDMKFFVNSEVRSKILLSLQDKPKDLALLRKELNFSSSTILHGMYQLEDKNLVIKNSGLYSLSQMGKLYALKLVSLMKSFSSMNNLESLFLNHEIKVIPPKLLQDIESLEKGIILESRPQDLMGPYKTISDKVLSSQKVKLISSVFYPFHLDVLKNSKSSGLKLDLIVTNDVGNILLNDYKEDLSEIKHSDVNLWKIDDHLKLSFALADEFMALGLFLENGVYDSNRFLISEGPDAVSWGNKLFNHYISQATEFKL